MFDRLTRWAAFGLYQTTVALGILLLPVALLSRRLGLPLPVDRLVERAAEACGAH